MGKQRPFPSELFENFSKRELQDFLEIFHYSVQAESDEDVGKVLLKAQRLLPFEHLIGGLVRVDSSGTFQDFLTVINVSDPNDWLYAYAKNGYAEADPVLVSLLRTFRTQIWTHSYENYENANSKKQQEFIEEAKSFGLANGITAGLDEPNQGLASFFSFSGGEFVDHQHYAGILEYLVDRLHDVLVRRPTP
ncbi:MAG: hypothetical protein C4293_02435, partial [Nitrospiraceae bacterium]